MDTASVLMEVLKIYSPPHGEAELAKWLHAYLKNHVDDVWIDDAGNVLAVKGRGQRGRSLCVYDLAVGEAERLRREAVFLR